MLVSLRVQDIKWRGLTEEGHKQLAVKIETERAEKLRQENRSLLEQIRLFEKKARDELVNAEVKYSIFLKQCKREQQVAARARIALRTSDLASLRPSLKGDGYKVYVEDPSSSLEQANSSLKQGLVDAEDRFRYWSAVWPAIMGLEEIINPSTDVVVHESAYLTPKGMTVSYGDDMKSKIAKAAPPWAFHGSFGTKGK